MRRVDEACRRGMLAGVFPGAVVLVGNNEGILFHRAYGHRALMPERLPMMPDTLFDLSSLTKPIATTTAMMLLVRDGRVQLDDTVCVVIPEFSRGAKAAITFRQLLNHTSGLPAWRPFYKSITPENPWGSSRSDEEHRGPRGVNPVLPGENAGRRRCLEGVHEEGLTASPGEKPLYSDLGFILLGEAVERLSGRPLDLFCQDEVFAPMGLASTFFATLDPCSRKRGPGPAHTVAATEDCPWRRKILCGEVHDDNAFVMGGIAGHAGVFSSALDVHRFIRFLARCRRGAEPQFLPATVVHEFLEAERKLPGQTHVLGWDTPSPTMSSSGCHFSAHTVGHLGFTGTSVWWDLERDVHVVCLTNRVHPSRANLAIRTFRPLVHDAVMEDLSS